MGVFKKLKIATNWIRGYEFGDPARNGEYFFLRQYLRPRMVVFDVGANVGEYTEYLASLHNDLHVFCFEPVRSTFDALKQRIDCMSNHGIKVFNVGLSDRAGHARLKCFGPLAGSNSLYERPYSFPGEPVLREETITLTTLDEFLETNSVTDIDLLKIDVEGHELSVIQGAVKTIRERRVTCIQFEYGNSFRDANITLESLCALLMANRYKIYRLWPFGKIRVNSAHVARLENYKHSNWVAIRA